MTNRWPMWLGLTLGLVALAAGLAYGENEVARWSAATRYTARVGFPLLILAYVARPLVDLSRAGWAKALLAKRKWIGLGFALSHTVHLFAIVTLFRTMGEWPPTATLFFGGIGYLFLYAMAFTSNRTAMKKLGRRWKLLHLTGIHYLWLVFAQSYFGRIFTEGKTEEGLIGFAVVVLAAALRFTAWQRKRVRGKSAMAG